MARKLKQPHEVKIVGNIPRLVKENFTVEFRMKGETPVLMQEGACFDAGGDVIEAVPDWAWEQFEKLSEGAKAKLAMVLPENKPWEGKKK